MIARTLALAAACLVACSSEATIIARRELSPDPDAEAPEDAPDAALDAHIEPDDAEADSEPAEDTGPPRDRCRNNDACGAGRYCSKRRCDDAEGECASRDTVCVTRQDPVCGCDGISYFNDCLRRQNGVSAMTPGECKDNAQLCGPLEVPGDCPKNSYCARLRAEPDPTNVICEIDFIGPGRCWVLPGGACDPSAIEGERYLPCVPAATFASTGGGGTPGGGGPGGGQGAGFGGGSSAPSCVSACVAIRSELPHFRTNFPCGR